MLLKLMVGEGRTHLDAQDEPLVIGGIPQITARLSSPSLVFLKWKVLVFSCVGRYLPTGTLV